MHKTWTMAILVAALTAFACGGEDAAGEGTETSTAGGASAAATAPAAPTGGAMEASGSEGLELTIDGRTMTLDQEWARVFMARNAMVYVANYDPGEDVSPTGGFAAPVSEGQIRVTMNLVPKRELGPGAYSAEAGTGQVLNFLKVEYFAEGEPMETDLAPREGTVQVTDISTSGSKEIAGTVDLTSGENGLEGRFFATGF